MMSPRLQRLDSIGGSAVTNEYVLLHRVEGTVVKAMSIFVPCCIAPAGLMN